MRLNKNSGVALILVTFILALAMILVNNLTYSTFLSSRTIGIIERELQAEYILKSLLNYSKAMLQSDTNLFDVPSDPFAMYTQGIPVAPALLGMEEENLGIDLEIIPNTSKFNLAKSNINIANESDKGYLTLCYNLFYELGFDRDNETHPYGEYRGKSFSVEEMVANLIDYQDTNDQNFNFPLSTPYLKNGSVNLVGNFDNKNFKNKALERITELSKIPGFTPNRIARLAPFVTFEGLSTLNINFLPDELYKSLDPNIMNDDVIKNIRNHLNTKNGFQTTEDFTNLVLGLNTYQGLYTTDTSNRYKILGKVSYGQTNFYMEAVIDKSQSLKITSLKFY